MPLAIEQFDLSSYDLIISSSHAVAKSVITGPNQLHISYVHSPIRYAWDLQYQYLIDSGLNKGLRGWFAKYLLHRIRKWDVATSNRVDFYIANSNFIKRRINKVYRRDSEVIFPPVSVDNFEDSVVLLGNIDRPFQLINEINILFSFSKGEGLPYTILEAMYAKKKMLISNVTGHDELLPENELFSLENYDDFRDKFAGIIRNIGPLNRDISKYTLKNNWININKIYQNKYQT